MYHWKKFLDSRKRLFILSALVITGLICTYIFSCFMVWNEGRAGYLLNDPLLNLITPRDFSLYTSFLTNVPILLGLILAMRKPEGIVYVFTAAIIICLLRIVTIFTVPLDPPTDIIPLRDVFIETFFYQGHVILKDLFFSGHTANLLLVAMLADILWLKRILVISGVCVGTLVLLQHVHYTIDVFAAPFFAIMSYKAAVHIVNKYFLKEYPYGTRTGNILEEFGFRKEKLSAARR